MLVKNAVHRTDTDLSGPEAEFTELEQRLAIDRELDAMKREGQGEAD